MRVDSAIFEKSESYCGIIEKKQITFKIKKKKQNKKKHYRIPVVQMIITSNSCNKVRSTKQMENIVKQNVTATPSFCTQQRGG